MQEASAAGRVEKTGTTWGTATLIGSLMRLAVETLTVITNDACEFWNVLEHVVCAISVFNK